MPLLSFPKQTVSGGAPSSSGPRSMLAFWMGGAGIVPSVQESGPRSLMAFWMGGAAIVSGVVTPPTTPTPSPQAGIRRARFLRRGPKLPWEEYEEEVKTDDGVVVTTKRRRIPLPIVRKIEQIVDPIPVEPIKEIPGFEIRLAELGTAHIDNDDDDMEDDLLLWMI